MSIDEKQYGEQKPTAIDPMEAARNVINGPDVHLDPSGSYTGKPKNRGEKPVQDADDL